MRSGESAQRGQLDYCLDPILKQYRQHDHITGNSFKQARANRNRVRGQVGNQHTAFLRRALSNQTFSHLQTPKVAVSSISGKGRKEHHSG